jgi:hypothetical protein
LDSHLSGPAVTSRLKRPTRRYRPGEAPACLVLQAVGFALPGLSPIPRCALTAPFHHCLPRLLGTSAVYFLLHFPSGRPGWPLAITVPCPARTFLPRRFASQKRSSGGDRPTRSFDFLLIIYDLLFVRQIRELLYQMGGYSSRLISVCFLKFSSVSG